MPPVNCPRPELEHTFPDVLLLLLSAPNPERPHTGLLVRMS